MTCQICEEAAREYEATVEADEDCTEFMANAIRANCRHSEPDAETVREACAKVCDDINSNSGGGFDAFGEAIRALDLSKLTTSGRAK